jgi:hypothetical protein
VVDEPSLLLELRADLLGEAEVGGVITVQVTDLAASDRERELAAPSRSGLDAGPRRDLLGDPLACRLFSRSHSTPPRSSGIRYRIPGYKFK